MCKKHKLKINEKSLLFINNESLSLLFTTKVIIINNESLSLLFTTKAIIINH